MLATKEIIDVLYVDRQNDALQEIKGVLIDEYGDDDNVTFYVVAIRIPSYDCEVMDADESDVFLCTCVDRGDNRLVCIPDFNLTGSDVETVSEYLTDMEIFNFEDDDETVFVSSEMIAELIRDIEDLLD